MTCYLAAARAAKAEGRSAPIKSKRDTRRQNPIGMLGAGTTARKLINI